MTNDLFRSLSDAAEADGVAGEASVGEARVLAESVGGAQGIGAGVPGAAAEYVLLAVDGSMRIGGRAGGVIARVIDVIAPLGHVAVHVEQPPAVGLFLADGVCLLPGIVGAPGAFA